MTDLPASADVIIVGAGILGVSTAFHLMNAGVRDILVLEAGEPAVSGSTPRSAAMLVHQTGIPQTTELAMKSIAEYSELHASGIDIGFRRTGGVLFATTPAGATRLRRQAEEQVAVGLATDVLDAAEVHQATGGILNVESVLVGIFCPTDGYLDPRKLVTAYLELMQAERASPVRPRVRATRINVRDGKVESVDTAKNTVQCRVVVNCAGVEARRMANPLGISLPIMSSLRCLAILSRQDLFPPDRILIEHFEDEWYFRPHDLGVLVGFGPHEWVDDDKTLEEPRFDFSLLEELDEYLRRFIPEIFPYTRIAEWAGYRPLLRSALGASDDLPILGPVAGVRGYFDCNGVGAYGVTLGAAAGEIVARAISSDTATESPAAQFTSDRFALPKQRSAPSRWFGWLVDEQGQLRCGSSSVEALAQELGTPLYLYDASIVRSRLDLLRRAFPGFEISYSIKSNPNRALCTMLAVDGLSAGISSEQELNLALEAGFPPSRINYAGPGKSTSSLRRALESGVGPISVESFTELGRLEDLARTLGRRVEVLIRVNTIFRPNAAGEFMAGLPSPFGVDEEVVPMMLQSVDRACIDVQGIHAFVASQVLGADSLAMQFERVAEMADRLTKDAGLPLRIVNFGGGFGVPYSLEEPALDIVSLGSEVCRGPAGVFLRRDNCRGMIEVGRFLTAEAGLFVTSITDVKASRGTKFVVTDSGISGLTRPAMPWAQDHGASIVTRVNDRAGDRFKVVGPSCMPSDVLAESVQLPFPRIGDLLGVGNAGAYGRSMSMLFWGGFPLPIEAMIDGDRIIVDGTRTGAPVAEHDA